MISTESNMVVPNFSEADCIAYFFALKWPDGFRCPQCGHCQAYTIRTRRLPLYQCHNCRHQTTVIAGTVMENSRTPLHKWRTALQLLSESSSINAVQLSKLIQVTYKTAWSILHKIRQAISQMDAKQLLYGKIFADVRIYNRKTLQPYVLHPKEIPVVTATSYHSGSDPAYIKLKVVSQELIDGKTLSQSGGAAFAMRHALPGFYKIIIQKRSSLLYETPSELFTQAKQWISQTFRGIGPKYLQLYWDEFCFRINKKYSDDNEPILDYLSRICLFAG